MNGFWEMAWSGATLYSFRKELVVVFGSQGLYNPLAVFVMGLHQTAMRWVLGGHVVIIVDFWGNKLSLVFVCPLTLHFPQPSCPLIKHPFIQSVRLTDLPTSNHIIQTVLPDTCQ